MGRDDASSDRQHPPDGGGVDAASTRAATHATAILGACILPRVVRGAACCVGEPSVRGAHNDEGPRPAG